jgi:hypothetical protein
LQLGLERNRSQANEVLAHEMHCRHARDRILDVNAAPASNEVSQPAVSSADGFRTHARRSRRRRRRTTGSAARTLGSAQALHPLASVPLSEARASRPRVHLRLRSRRRPPFRSEGVTSVGAGERRFQLLLAWRLDSCPHNVRRHVAEKRFSFRYLIGCFVK